MIELPREALSPIAEDARGARKRCCAWPRRSRGTGGAGEFRQGEGRRDRRPQPASTSAAPWEAKVRVALLRLGHRMTPGTLPCSGGAESDQALEDRHQPVRPRPVTRTASRAHPGGGRESLHQVLGPVERPRGLSQCPGGSTSILARNGPRGHLLVGRQALRDEPTDDRHATAVSHLADLGMESPRPIWKPLSGRARDRSSPGAALGVGLARGPARDGDVRGRS